MKIYPQVLTFFLKPKTISRCCFADDGNEKGKSEKRTCRACKATVFTHLICKFVTFSLPSPLSLLKLPNMNSDNPILSSKVTN